MVSIKINYLLLVAVTLLTVMVFYVLKPIPQLQSYHHFADQRSWLGIPNALNVLSNIAIALPGLWGLFLLFSPNKVQFNNHRERWFWIGVSIGLILTAVGSSYYHLAPNDLRLLWDRFPMSVVFMSFAAALINERCNSYIGLWLWPVLLGIGLYSVWWWYVTSDLRFYIGMQVFTILVALVMLFSPVPYDRKWDLAGISICYGFTLLFDLFDHQIYGITNEVVSGHTLKHLMVGLAGAWLIWMVWRRKKEKYI